MLWIAVVWRCSVREHGRMTNITLQDGMVVMYGTSAGTELDCCCGGCAPCPDLESLCISITLTDYNGNVHTADEGDIFWFAGSGSVYLAGFDYAVTILCDTSTTPGGIGVNAGWGGFIGACGGQCTSGSGSALLECSPSANWYAATVSGTIFFHQACDPGCPANLGTFSVTFSDPPC